MIIDCKCKKYKFKIPQQDITSIGRNVICEICKEEWFQPFSDPKNNLIDKYNEIVFNAMWVSNINLSETENIVNTLKNKLYTRRLLNTKYIYII